MGAPDNPSRHSPGLPGSRWGETFLNRFDLKVRSAGRILHPISGEQFKVDPKVPAQSFRRNFGEVQQFTLTSGLLKKDRLHMVAVSLHAGGLRDSGAGPIPAEDIPRRLAGTDGLDFRDESFYCVAVFSPVGWPDIWRVQSEIRGNAIHYFVEKQEGTRWQVSGPPGPLRDLFDPEDDAEKKTRAREALATLSKLVLPSNQVLMDSFLEEQHLDRKSVDAIVEASEGRLQIIEHKGKTYIQRSIR